MPTYPGPTNFGQVDEKTKFIDKWRAIGAAIPQGQDSVNAYNATMQQDAKRLARGSKQWSQPQSLTALTAAINGKPTTAAPSNPTGVLGTISNLGSDIADFGVGLGKAAIGAVADIGNLSHTWQNWKAAQAKIDDPRNKANLGGKIAQEVAAVFDSTPIVRKIPIVGKEFPEFLRHPLGATDPNLHHEVDRKKLMAQFLKEGMTREEALANVKLQMGTDYSGDKGGLRGAINRAADIFDTNLVGALGGSLVSNVLRTGDDAPGGGIGDWQQHPLVPALAALGVGKALARGSKAAEAVAARNLADGMTVQQAKAHPLGAWIAHKIGDDGEIVRRGLAVPLDHVIEGTRFGHTVWEAVSPSGRKLSMKTQDARDQAEQAAVPGAMENLKVDATSRADPYLSPLQEAARAKAIHDASGLVLPEQEAAFFNYLTTGVWHEEGPVPANIVEAQKIWKPVSDEFTDVAVDQALIGRDPVTGEIFDIKTLNKINRRRRLDESATAEVDTLMGRVNEKLHGPKVVVEGSEGVAGARKGFALDEAGVPVRSPSADPMWDDFYAQVEAQDFDAAIKTLRTMPVKGTAPTPYVATARQTKLMQQDWETGQTLYVGSRERGRGLGQIAKAIEEAKVNFEAHADPTVLNHLYEEQAAAAARFSQKWGESVAKWDEATVHTDAGWKRFAEAVRNGEAPYPADFARTMNLGAKSPFGQGAMRPPVLITPNFHTKMVKTLEKAKRARDLARETEARNSPHIYDEIQRQIISRVYASINASGDFKLTGKLSRKDARKAAAFAEIGVDSHQAIEALSMIANNHAREALELADTINGHVLTVEEKAKLIDDAQALITNEVVHNWQQADYLGQPIMFVPQVPDSVARRFGRADIAGGVTKVSTGMERSRMIHNPGEYTRRVGVAIPSAVWNAFDQVAQKSFADWFAGAYGKGIEHLHSLYDEMAQKRAGHTMSANTESAHFLAEVQKRWDVYDPENMNILTKPTMEDITFRAGRQPVIFIPKGASAMMKRISNGPSGLQKALAIPNAVFRTTVVGLSPTTQLNNVTGNTFMTMITRPSAALHVRSAAAMLKATKDGMLTEEGFDRMIRREVRRGKGMTKERGTVLRANKDQQNLINELQSTSLDYREVAHAGALKASSLVDKWLDSNSITVRGAAHIAQVAEKLGIPFTKAADKMMQWNGWVDDLTRQSLFLAEFEKQMKHVKHGSHSIEDLNSAAANAREMVLKTAMNWKALTPFERAYLRPIIPFYAWQRHILQFSLDYAMDHPFRTAIGANLLQTEREDEATGYPAAFRDLFFLNPQGDGRPHGDNQAINIGGMNPFGQMAGPWGILGFLSGDAAQAGQSVATMSPLFKWGMQTLGMDPRSGYADLFPDAVFDPQTGKLELGKRQPISGLVGSLAPQVGLVSPLLHTAGADTVANAIDSLAPTDLSEQLNRMRVQDPAAYRRQMYTGAHLPMLWRDVHPQGEIGKQEILLKKSAKDALRLAIQTGDYSEAEKWPTLRQPLALIKAAYAKNPKALDRFRTPTSTSEASAQSDQLMKLTQLPTNLR